MNAEVTQSKDLFELDLALPDERLEKLSRRLVGFNTRYERIRQDLRLLSNPDEIGEWSKKYYHKVLPLCEVLMDRYPLVIFGGDVGTGKTATAETVADKLSREMDKDARLYKLSTRVRGSGKVGQMSTLINQAFEIIEAEVGKKRVAYLILDEGDSLGASRQNTQSHHEDKVGVNTIIQKIDDLRRFDGRILVFLCTNRMDAMDPAILRRAARIEYFDRPNDAERQELLEMDLKHTGVSGNAIAAAVRLTGAQNGTPGFTYSDLRSRLMPEVVGYAFPNRKISDDDLLNAVSKLKPSPAFSEP